VPAKLLWPGTSPPWPDPRYWTFAAPISLPRASSPRPTPASAPAARTALAWSGTPESTAQLLLVIQDIDSPTRTPFVHCVALLEPELVTLPTGALNAGSPIQGVRVLRSGMGRGYMGPEPIKGHGMHRYVFQLFALPTTITSAEGDASLDAAKPRAILATVSGPVLARGRLDGLYTR
jgi:phosphatidylethanolamine-binding protein (PEBP) family uncharacterized protein